MLLASIGVIAGGGASAVGGFDSIATVTVGTNTNQVQFTSIPQTYDALQIRIDARITNGNYGLLRMNGEASTIYYYTHYIYSNGGGVSGGSTSSWAGLAFNNTNYTSDSHPNVAIIDINGYAITTAGTTAKWLSGTDTNSTTQELNVGSGAFSKAQAITNIQLLVSNGNFWLAGSTFELYGIKAAV